jgi:hypothetical protein
VEVAVAAHVSRHAFDSPNLGGLLHCWNSVRGVGKNQGTDSRKLTKLTHDKRHWKLFLVLILAPFAWVGIRGVLGSRTKDFHRQMKEPDFRFYRLLLDEQAEQVCASTDDVGARAQDWPNTQEQQLRIRSTQ